MRRVFTALDIKRDYGFCKKYMESKPSIYITCEDSGQYDLNILFLEPSLTYFGTAWKYINRFHVQYKNNYGPHFCNRKNEKSFAITETSLDINENRINRILKSKHEKIIYKWYGTTAKNYSQWKDLEWRKRIEIKTFI